MRLIKTLMFYSRQHPRNFNWMPIFNFYQTLWRRRNVSEAEGYWELKRRTAGAQQFSTGVGQGSGSMSFQTRDNLTETGLGSYGSPLTGTQIPNVQDQKPQTILKLPEKEMNDERIKRMRAYQQFLRIQENEKNTKGLLEDFGSNVIDILKVPVQTVSKVPQYIQQGTNMLTIAILPGRSNQEKQSSQNPSNRNSQKGKTSETLFQKEGTQYLLGQENNRANQREKDKFDQLNQHMSQLESERLSSSVHMIKGGDSMSNLRNSRVSEMQIIVDSSRIVQLSEDRKGGENDSTLRDNTAKEFNLELQDLDPQSKATQLNNDEKRFEIVLGQGNIEPDKFAAGQCLNEDRDKYGVYLQEDFNYSDYLGDLNLRQIQLKKDKTKRWIPLQPDSNFKISWDMVGFFLIIYQAMMIPYRFCFKSKAKGYYLYFETAIDIFFMTDFDLVATFPYSWIIQDKKIEYWPEEHEVQDDGTSSNEQNQGSGNNTLTNLSVVYDPYLPFNYHYKVLSSGLPPVFTTTSATDFGLPALLRLLKLVRLIRLVKALQIFKLRKFIYRYEWFFFNDFVTIVSDLFKVMVAVLFVIHWVSCIFFLIADIEDDTQDQETWLLLLSKTDLGSPINVYIAAVSFSFTTITSTGYGDIYAVTNIEKCFAMFAMIISCGIFAYIVGFLGALFDRSNQIIGEFQEKIIRINQYLVKVKAPKYFQKQVKRYLIYLMANKNENKMEEGEVFEMLSDNLKQELIIHLNGKMLHQTPPFYHFKLDFLLDITFILRRETFTMDEKLFEEDDQGDHLHYVTKGHVNLTHRKTATYIKEISYDTFLGELSFFSGLPRKASAKSKNFTETLTLYMNDFMDAISSHEEEQIKFDGIRKQILVGEDYSLLGTKCYICQELGHISIDCNEFRVIKGNLKQAVIERMHQQELRKKQQKEAEFLRANNPKQIKKRNEDSIDSEDELMSSSSFQDNSLEDMFSYLEKRYKNEENSSPKSKRQDETNKVDSQSQSQGIQLKEISPISNKPAKITHLAQVLPMTESRNIQNLKNQILRNPQNIDEIEEHSVEESVLSRESILLRQSIESQLALVNKLTEIQSAGGILSHSMQFKRTNTAGRDKKQKVKQRISGMRGSEYIEDNQEGLDDYSALQSLEKIRLSRGYLGKSMIAKGSKLPRFDSEFERIDEEDDEEMLIHKSTPHRTKELESEEIEERKVENKYHLGFKAGKERQRIEEGGIDFDQLGNSLIPLSSINKIGSVSSEFGGGGGLMAQIIRNTQDLEEMKEDQGLKKKCKALKDQKYQENQLIRHVKQGSKKITKVGQVPDDFQFSYDENSESDDSKKQGKIQNQFQQNQDKRRQ